MDKRTVASKDCMNLTRMPAVLTADRIDQSEHQSHECISMRHHQAALLCITSLACVVLQKTLSVDDYCSHHQQLWLIFPLYRAKLDGPYDSRWLPVMLTICMIVSMGAVFLGALKRITSPDL